MTYEIAVMGLAFALCIFLGAAIIGGGDE